MKWVLSWRSSLRENGSAGAKNFRFYFIRISETQTFNYVRRNRARDNVKSKVNSSFGAIKNSFKWDLFCGRFDRCAQLFPQHDNLQLSLITLEWTEAAHMLLLLLCVQLKMCLWWWRVVVVMRNSLIECFDLIIIESNENWIQLEFIIAPILFFAFIRRFIRVIVPHLALTHSTNLNWIHWDDYIPPRE